MKKFLKWAGRVLLVLLGLIVFAMVVFYFKGEAMGNHAYAIAPENIPIPTDPAFIERGRHFVHAICADCHTDDLSGKAMINAPFATIYSANLTPGTGGAGTEFTDTDWVWAIRHGVDNKGRDLVIMPAQVFWNFNDQDLGDIVAYLKSLPPIDKEHPDPQINVLGKIMFGAGLFGPAIIPANMIAHDQRPPMVPVGVTAQYGEYLVDVTGCHDCHGIQLAGGRSTKPGALTAPNLTPGGDLKTWTDVNFNNTIRTGVTPKGHALKPDEMPWKHFTNYSDDELKAIFMYLQSLTALPTIIP